MFYFPPVLQRFMRSKAWWNVIKHSPADVYNYLTVRHPVLGLGLGVYLYLYFWRWPLQEAAAVRSERFHNNWKASVHYQQNVDFETKKTRDELRHFITTQIAEHGSLDKALDAYEAQTGKKAPPLLMNDPVLDHSLAKVGVPVPCEPSFLWDGTSYMGEENRPMTFADGKVKIPDAPNYYLHR